MRLVLERLAEQGEELFGTPHHPYEEEAAFVVEMENCPYCAEIARRGQAEGRAIARPVCHIPAAAIEEMMEWATGEKHLVEETACIALGEPTCRFRIAK
jgi:predicted hydrocarbon binding protein